MWWLNAESPSGNAAAQVQSVEQISHSVEAVKQSQSELRARDSHISAQSEPLQGQRDLKQQTASSARQHELPHKVRETQSKLFAVIDRQQAQRAEQPRTSKESELQLAAPQSHKRELEAKLAELADLHAVAQAKLNAKLFSLELELSEQQRALHEQVERSAAQVAALEVLHANRLTAQLNAAQVAKYAAIARAREADSQHAAAVEQLTARSEQLVVRESKLAEALSELRVTEEKLTARTTSLQLQLEQSRASESQLIQQELQTKQHHDQQVGQLQADIARLQLSIDQQCSQDAEQRQTFAELKSQHALQLVTQRLLLDEARAAENVIALRLSDCNAKHMLDLEQLQEQIVSLHALLAKRESDISALREATIESATERELSKDQKTKLQASLSAKDDELVCLRSTIAQLTSEKEQSENHKAKQDVELDCLCSTISQLTSEKEQSDNHKAKQDDELDCLRSTIAQLASEKEQSDNHKANLQAAFSDQQSEVSALSATIAKLEFNLGEQSIARQKLLDAAQSTQEVFNERLDSTNAKHTAQYQEMQDTADQLRSTLAARESEVTDLKQLLVALESKRAILRATHHQFIQQAGEKERILRSQWHDCKELHAAQLSKLRAANAQQQATIAKRELVISELQNEILRNADAHAELIARHEQEIIDTQRANADARVRQEQLQRQRALDVESLQLTIGQYEQSMAARQNCIEELEAKLFDASEAREQLTNECTELNRALAEHRSSSDRAEAAASTRLAEVQQQQAVEVATLRSTLSLLESSLQNSSREKEAAQAEQELAHRHQLAEIERQSAIQAAESEKALRKQLEPLTRKLAELQTRLDETLRAKREMDGAHAEECNSLRGESEQLSCELQEQGKSLNEALSALAETRSQLSSEQTLRRQAEADRADYSRCAEQSRNHATTWLNRLQKESAERRKAESALLRAADTADQETVARVAQAELDARNRCERLNAELVATRAVAANTQRRMVSEFKRAREEVVRLRSKLEIRQAAANTIPMPGQSEESVVEPMQWVTPQSKAS